MKSVSAEVGIDVSKEWLDVCVEGSKPFRAANTEEGIRSLAGRLPKGSVIHLESSGGYERLCRRHLRKAGFQVGTHDPLKVRRMAQAKSHRAKTDALDARHLAGNGSSLPAQPEKSLAREGLCDLSRTIQTLKLEMGRHKVRAAAAELDKTARNAYLDCAKATSRLIQRLEKEFVRRVEASDLRERYELALTVPGVGPCLARVAVAELPEKLDEYTVAQLTSYAGVAPIDDASGKRKGPSKIKPGNRHLKAALYMPALGRLQKEEWARDLYARLRAKGRLHEQASVAVMRRLLVRILQVLQRGTPWVIRPENA